MDGCSQGERVTIYYRPDMYNQPALQNLEMEYWNTGAEFSVSETEDPEDDPNGPVCYYCHHWDDDDNRRELAEALCCDPDEIRLYLFDGWTRGAKYRIA